MGNGSFWTGITQYVYEYTLGSWYMKSQRTRVASTEFWVAKNKSREVVPYARRRKSIKTTTFRKGIPNPIISYRSIYRKHLEALTPFQISNAEKCADQQPLGCWLLGDHFYAPPLLQPRYHLLVLVLFTQKQLSLSYTSITLTLSLECREQVSWEALETIFFVSYSIVVDSVLLKTSYIFI